MESRMMQAVARVARAMRTQTRRLYRDEKGAAVAFLVVIPVLAGTVAIGIETGQMYRLKRQMQGAADAAALAAAVDRLASKSDTVIQATARYEAQRNGFTNGANTVNVTVNTPPTSGAYVSTPGAVEVIVTKSHSFSLGNVLNSWLGRSTSGFTMQARSVAAQGSYTQSTTSYEGCMVALTTVAEQGVSFTNFNNFTSDCTIMSNAAATGSGTSASVTITDFNNASIQSLWTRGSFYSSAYNHMTYATTGAPFTNQTGMALDPYANLPTPTPGTCSYTNFNGTNGGSGPDNKIDLSPGTYCGGITVTGGVGTVAFQPGIYYIADGDLYLTGVNNVRCPNCTSDNGVAFVLTRVSNNNDNIGGVKITSDNNVTLNAGKTNTGPYAGVLFYQDRRVATGNMASTAKIFTVTALNNATLTGAIYFPNNKIEIATINNFGGTASTGCTIWVGRYIKFQNFNNNYKGGCSAYGTTPVGIVTTTTVYKGKVFE
jgi:Flp pilus assembly protein TadG